jgi:hypothetical protein
MTVAFLHENKVLISLPDIAKERAVLASIPLGPIQSKLWE